jgi:putative transposase
MSFDPESHHRRSIRLKGYDYTTVGGYFVTICTAKREHLFGAIENADMKLNSFGRIVHDHWHNLPSHYPTIMLDEFVIMPNHIHGIIFLADKPKEQTIEASKIKYPALSEVVRAFKSFSSRLINMERGTSGTAVWQQNYYEHIIRNDETLDRLRTYIVSNPARWENDPDNVSD